MKKIFKRFFSFILAIVIAVSCLNLTGFFNLEVYAASKENEIFTDTDKEFTYTAPKTGQYYIKMYGASGGGKHQVSLFENETQGASQGGYGGCVEGYINLTKNTKLYINVGGVGGTTANKNGTITGGYNGGGKAYKGAGSGGGATSIALKTGKLSALSSAANRKK